MLSLERCRTLVDDVRCAARMFREDLFPPRPILEVEGAMRPGDVEEFRPEAPEWIEQTALAETIERWSEILLKGRTTWGCVLKLNHLLLQEGEKDHVAVVAWSPDGAWDDDPKGFQQVMSRVYKAANRSNSPEDLRDVSEMLRDEYTCPMGLGIPETWTEGRIVLLSQILVVRSHVPGGRLLQTVLPIRVLESERSPVLVPGLLWSQRLREWWLRGGHLEPLTYPVTMMGGRGAPKAWLPPELRRYLSARRREVLSATSFGLLSVATIFAEVHWWPHLHGLKGAVAMMAVVFGLFPTLILPNLALGWLRHQRVIDLYQELWRGGWFPWSSFRLLPSKTATERDYSLCMRVLGNNVILNPVLTNDKFFVSVHPGGEKDQESEQLRRLGKVVPIPSNRKEVGLFLSELRMMYLAFGNTSDEAGKTDLGLMSW